MGIETEILNYSETLRGEFKLDGYILDQSRTLIHNQKNYNTYSLIIPAYNEENRIGPFLTQMSKMPLDKWEIIIVCDGTDKTAEIAENIDARFRILVSANRLGKGGAILEGFKHATGDVVGYVDADGAIAPEEIVRVFNKINNQNRIIVGSRWMMGSEILVPQPPIRIVLGRLYHYFAFALLGLKTKDIQCGLKAFDSDIIQDVTRKITLKNLSFDTALLYHCSNLGFEITEVPVAWKDVSGSKVRPMKTAVLMFLSLIGLRIAHSKNASSFENLINTLRVFVEDS